MIWVAKFIKDDSFIGVFTNTTEGLLDVFFNAEHYDYDDVEPVVKIEKLEILDFNQWLLDVFQVKNTG